RALDVPVAEGGLGRGGCGGPGLAHRALDGGGPRSQCRGRADGLLRQGDTGENDHEPDEQDQCRDHHSDPDGNGHPALVAASHRGNLSVGNSADLVTSGAHPGTTETDLPETVTVVSTAPRWT